MDRLTNGRDQPTNPTTHANFRHLYADIFWYGVLLGSAIGFLSVYAARLDATGFQVAVLTAGPAVVNLLFSLPAGQWLVGRSLVHVAYRSSLWNRAGYLALVPLPWVFADPNQVWMLILFILLMSVPGTLLAVAFNAMFAEVVPPEWRGHVVGRRQALLAVSAAAASVLCGQLLDRIAFPLNYQIVFGIGALGAALSSYHLGRIRSLELQSPAKQIDLPLQDPGRPGVLRFGDAMRAPLGLRFLAGPRDTPALHLDPLRGRFSLLLVAFMLFYAFQYVPIPLFPLFWVQELHLSDGAISLGNALFYAMMLVTSMGLRSISDRYGHRRVLIFGALLYCLYPLLNGLASDASLFWVSSLVGGGVWALTSAGLVNRLMERVPDDDRPAHMAWHNLVLNLGVLAGSALGPLLGNWLGLRQALLMSAALRLLAAAVLGVWG